MAIKEPLSNPQNNKSSLRGVHLSVVREYDHLSSPSTCRCTLLFLNDTYGQQPLCYFGVKCKVLSVHNEAKQQTII
jgi:hypothetical protein